MQEATADCCSIVGIRKRETQQEYTQSDSGIHTHIAVLQDATEMFYIDKFIQVVQDKTLLLEKV